jgi:hypothetical protein
MELGEVAARECVRAEGERAFDEIDVVQQRIVVERLDLLESIAEVHSDTIHPCFADSQAPLRRACVASESSSFDCTFKRHGERRPLRGSTALRGIDAPMTRSAPKRSRGIDQRTLRVSSSIWATDLRECIHANAHVG